MNLQTLLLRVNIDSKISYKKAIENALMDSKQTIFFYLNSHVFYEAHKNMELLQNLFKADFIIGDGMSIVWGIKKIFKKNIEKVVFTYSYFEFIRELFIKKSARVFFLGAKPNVILKAVKNEKQNYPQLKIVGYSHGYFNKPSETEEIIKRINQSNANVLIVGMGCPTAENWIVENSGKISTNLIFSVGGFFDFLANEKIVAPKPFYNSGFEWVFRLVQEPKRLFKRYLYANAYFIFFIIQNVIYKDKNV